MKPASVLLALLLALAFSAPALAAKGGNGNGKGGNNGGNAASEDAGNNGNGNGYGNGNGNAHGHDKLDDVGVDITVTVVPNEQEEVQRAVEANKALPLDDITALVQGDTTGRILDVQLVRFRDVYLYDVTVLEQNGVLHKLYYNAHSGRPVRTK